MPREPALQQAALNTRGVVGDDAINACVDHAVDICGGVHRPCVDDEAERLGRSHIRWGDVFMEGGPDGAAHIGDDGRQVGGNSGAGGIGHPWTVCINVGLHHGGCAIEVGEV